MNPMCPTCLWEPPAQTAWSCDHCSVKFNTFKTNGVCPGCGKPKNKLGCPVCKRATAYDDWLAFAPKTPMPRRPFKPEQIR
jgi:predicted amidophosphoribosyltransferase